METKAFVILALCACVQPHCSYDLARSLNPDTAMVQDMGQHDTQNARDSAQDQSPPGPLELCNLDGLERCGVLKLGSVRINCGHCKFGICGGSGQPNICAPCSHPTPVADCSEFWCTIPAGCFTMGSPESEPCRGPRDGEPLSGQETQHQVLLTHGFMIMDHEVTQQEYKDRMGVPEGNLLEEAEGLGELAPGRGVLQQALR